MRKLPPTVLPFVLLVVAAARADDGSERARALGTRIAKAQKRNDLLEEQRLWISCREELAPADSRAVWAAIMEPLDAARGGAFVSAHLLAERLVLACVDGGDREHLDAATAVLEARAKAKGAGRHVALVLRLARAVAANGAGAADVAAAAAKEGWPELAGYAAIATFQGAGAAKEDAKKAEDAAVAALIAANDPALAIAWAQPIKARLTTNAAAVSAVTRVMKEIGAIPVQMLGGNDRTGGGTTELGRAWKRLGSRGTIATLARGKEGLDLAHPFEKFEVKRAAEPGVKVHGHGGVHLALNRFGVAVRLLDVDGGAAPGDGSGVPGPFDLVHRLAAGETWTLTRSGVRIR